MYRYPSLQKFRIVSRYTFRILNLSKTKIWTNVILHQLPNITNKRALTRNIDRINRIKDDLLSSPILGNNLMKVNFRQQFRGHSVIGQEFELKLYIYILLLGYYFSKLRGLVHVLGTIHLLDINVFAQPCRSVLIEHKVQTGTFRGEKEIVKERDRRKREKNEVRIFTKITRNNKWEIERGNKL